MNHSPSFSTDTPLDLDIKKQLILDTLALVRVDAKQLRKGKAADKQQAAERLLRAKGRATCDQPSAVSVDEMQSIRYRNRIADGLIGQLLSSLLISYQSPTTLPQCPPFKCTRRAFSCQLRDTHHKHAALLVTQSHANPSMLTIASGHALGSRQKFDAGLLLQSRAALLLKRTNSNIYLDPRPFLHH